MINEGRVAALDISFWITFVSLLVLVWFLPIKRHITLSVGSAMNVLDYNGGVLEVREGLSVLEKCTMGTYLNRSTPGGTIIYVHSDGRDLEKIGVLRYPGDGSDPLRIEGPWKREVKKALKESYRKMDVEIAAAVKLEKLNKKKLFGSQKDPYKGA